MAQTRKSTKKAASKKSAAGKKTGAQKSRTSRARSSASAKATPDTADATPDTADTTPDAAIAKKASAKKATAKKATAKKASAKKASAKKATAKKASARKATAKKAPAKKTTETQATAKEATAKEAPAKKAPAKKALAKKKDASAKANETAEQTSSTAKKAAPSGGSAASEDEHPNLTLTRGLAEIVKSHDLDELIYDTGDLTLTLRRSGRVSAQAVAPVGSVAPAREPVHMVAPQPNAMRDSLAGLAHSAIFAETPPDPSTQFRERSMLESAPDDEFHLITSPFVGTFYRRPSPEADTYVTLGSRVAKGQVLCIIEAMKLMNEIESDVSGTIADILVEDAQPVEYGQPLFKILFA